MDLGVYCQFMFKEFDTAYCQVSRDVGSIFRGGVWVIFLEGIMDGCDSIFVVAPLLFCIDVNLLEDCRLFTDICS